MTETIHQSLREVARSLRDGTATARGLYVRAAEAYEATDGRLNAYKTFGAQGATRQADAADALLATGIDLGPLMGIPVSVKDLYGVPGMPVFAGTATEFPKEWQRPGPLVSRLQGQLGIVTGKTHTVELAFGGLGTNPHWGTPLNPWSPDAPRIPGGSSSGAGVSLVQGSALLALGTDTAGSVRIPASVTGQVGLKTTSGRWSQDGIVPLSPSLDTPGLLARSAQDLAFGFAALDPAWRDRVWDQIEPLNLGSLRIGVPDRPFNEGIDVSIANLVQATLSKLSKVCAAVLPVTLDGCDEVLEVFRQGGLAAPELRAFLDANFPERIAALDPSVRARIEGVDAISATEYLRRRSVLHDHGQKGQAVFDTCDVLATATVAISPPLLADIRDGDAYRQANMMALRNPAIVNLFGWCALTMPIGLDTNGMPVGLQLIAPPYKEERLLAIACAIEAHLGQGSELMGRPQLPA